MCLSGSGSSNGRWIAGVCVTTFLLWMPRPTVAQAGPAQKPEATTAQTLPDAPLMNVPDDAESSAAMSEEAAAEMREPGEADTVRGSVTDRDGVAIFGALVVMRFAGAQPERAERTGADGSFEFHAVPAGEFALQVSRAMYVTRLVNGTLKTGGALRLPQILMVETAAGADAQVMATSKEMATEQLRLEEKQRVLGVFPNYYVSYLPNSAPLSPRNKWDLAIRSTLDPINFVLLGVSAGIEQATNAFSGYGQGAQGYAKRYGAGFADDAIGTVVGGAILPILLKQDPRYFWKGTGTVKQRATYAMSRVVICKGDNGKWQPNYSGVVGNLVSAGISNAYYPASDRNGAGLTFVNLAIGTGAGALANLYQEFFSKRMTPAAEHMPAQATGLTAVAAGH